MSVTLEVSKLSGWLKASASCRESTNGASNRGKRVARKGWRHRGEGLSSSASSGVRVCGPPREWGKRRRQKRTANIPLMSVTLEVSKLSGWLKATAYCQVQRGHPAEGDACGTRRRGTQREGQTMQQRTRRACVAEVGSGAKGAGKSVQRTFRSCL